MKKLLIFLIGILLCLGITLEARAERPQGEAFSAQQSISKSWGDDSLNPDIAYESYNGTDYVYAVWLEEGFPGKGYFARSTDGGVTWETPVMLTLTAQTYKIRVSARSSYVYVVIEWGDPGEIWFIRSTDNGATWDITNDWQRITVNSGDSSSPDIACSGPGGSSVYITWMDNSPFGYYTIFFKYNNNYGVGSWSSAKRLTWTNVQALYPRIESGNTSSGGLWGNVYVVYHDFYFNSSAAEIFICINNNFGDPANWGNPRRLTWSSGNSIYPVVDASQNDGYVHIAWEEYFSSKGAYNIVYKRLEDYGTTFPVGITKRLSFSTNHSRYPSISALGGDVYVAVAWFQYLGGNYEIIWKEDNNYGTGGWGSTKRLTFTSGDSMYPSICYQDSDTTCHVIYQDNTLASGKAEIYHRKGY